MPRAPLKIGFLLIRITITLAIAVLAIPVSVVQAQPANDQCANAIEVFVDTPIAGTSVGASGTNLSSCAGSGDVNDVWYYFIPGEDGLATFSLCGSASWDTTLSVFASCGGAELGCDDDACGDLRSTTTVGVLMGQTYYVRVAGYGGATGTFTLTATLNPGGSAGGVDVVYSDTQGIHYWGSSGGIHAYSLSSHTCNLGDANLPWNSTSPLLGMNAYKLANGRLEQIGMSWLKNATVAAAGSGCGLPCNGSGGSQLGAGCRDIYGASYNGGQGILGPRSACNAFTGQYPGPSGGSGNAIYKRLQISTSDIDPNQNAGALYFSEGVYVAATDASAGNALNNASYKQFTVELSFQIFPVGPMHVGEPAIMAWRDHGLGIGNPDESVELTTVDVPSEGRFHVASKVTPLGNGMWRYDYAIYNLNSHRSAGSLSVPFPTGTTIANVGFHDVDYHSGEPFDNTDWPFNVNANDVKWNSPQTFAQNANSNALRFGTMYNFWFDADVGPVSGEATIGLFRTGSPDSVAAMVRVPGACAGDCFVDGQRNGLDIQGYLDCVLGVAHGDCGCADISAQGFASIADLDAFVDMIIGGDDCPL